MLSHELIMAIAWSPAVVVGIVAVAVLLGFFVPLRPVEAGRRRGGHRVGR